MAFRTANTLSIRGSTKENIANNKRKVYSSLQYKKKIAEQNFATTVLHNNDGEWLRNFLSSGLIRGKKKKKVSMTSIMPSKRHILVLEKELKVFSKQILIQLESK